MSAAVQAALLEALKEAVDLAEFWINREDRRGYSEQEFKAWHALGFGSKALNKARAAIASTEAEAQAPSEAVPGYGGTDFGFTFAGLPLTDGDKRLAAMVTMALGNDHPAFYDLTALFFAARGKGATPPAQQVGVAGEPDMRHPKIQRLIGSNARKDIEMRLVEQLLEEGPDTDLSSMDMEYWGPTHDRLREALLAASPPPAAPADHVRMPTTEAEAELMAKLGYHWLRVHAPHRLTAAERGEAQHKAECPANGSQACQIGPHGPSGAPQCEWCGEPPQHKAEPVAHTSERHFALCEAHCIGASDAYFKVWPTHDNDAGRMLFERGFVRGFDASEKLCADPAPTQPVPLTDEQAVNAMWAARSEWMEAAGIDTQGIEHDAKHLRAMLPYFRAAERAHGIASPQPEQPGEGA